MGWGLSKSAGRWARLTLQGLGFAPTRAADVAKEAAALALFAWLPLGLIGVVHGLWIGAWGSYFADFAVHARFLVAIPLIHLAARGLVLICRVSLRRMASEEMGSATKLKTLEESFGRWLRSRRVAGLIAVLCFLLGQAVFWEPIAGRTVLGDSLARPDFLYELWATWVGLPVFYVVTIKALLLWGEWCRDLLRLARMPLDLSAAHPDYAGGLEFLVRPSRAFYLVIAGLASILSAAWGAKIAFAGAPISEFGKMLALWSAVALLVTMGPLVVLAPRLHRARILGLREYGRLASSYTRQFEQRWILSPPDRPLLGTSDLQSLADLGNSFRVVREMRVVPFQGKDFFLVVLAAAGPMLPLVLTQVPLKEILARMAGLLLR